MMCTVSSAEDEIKGHEQRTQKRGHSGLPRMPPDIQGLGRPGPGPALGASESGRVTIELEGHGGYFCAGCKRSWTSLVSLNHHRAFMRGTECEEENNSKELRNIFRANLATGPDSRPPVLLAGILKVAVNMHKRIHLAHLSQDKSYWNVM